MNINFYDYQSKLESFRTAVHKGLTDYPKKIHHKFLYNEEGSKLFDQLCEHSTYYVPHVEYNIIKKYIDEIINYIKKDCHIIELGAGSNTKIRPILEKIKPALYAPMDISSECLKKSAQKLSHDYPDLPIHAICLDHSKPYSLPLAIPMNKRLFCYFGNSLGNLTPEETIQFLADIHSKTAVDSLMLIGIDTKKPTDIFEKAYNDKEGIVGAFNLNLLQRMKDELNTKINQHAFENHVFYNEELGRIEMYLRSLEKQQIIIDDSTYTFQKKESIHIEYSYKYTPDEFKSLALKANWKSEMVWQDEELYFSIHLLRPINTR